MANEQNKAVVRRLIEEAYSGGKVSVLQDVYTRDVCDHNPAPGQPRGLEGQRWMLESIYRAIPDMTSKVKHIVAEGDYVADYWTSSGTNKGEFMGMPPTGKRFTITGADLVRFSGGKIAEIWHQEDMLGMLLQLGLVSLPQMQAMPSTLGKSSTAGRPSESGRSGSPSYEERRALIRRAFEEFIDKGNPGAADRYLTPDYVGHFSAAPEVRGPDGLRQFIEMYNTALSNQRAQVENILLEGDYGACRVTFTGKHTGNLFGVPPTGKQITNHSLNFFRFAGDRVAEQWANNDDIGLFQTIGAIPVAAGTPLPEPC